LGSPHFSPFLSVDFFYPITWVFLSFPLSFSFGSHGCFGSQFFLELCPNFFLVSVVISNAHSDCSGPHLWPTRCPPFSSVPPFLTERPPRLLSDTMAVSWFPFRRSRFLPGSFLFSTPRSCSGKPLFEYPASCDTAFLTTQCLFFPGLATLRSTRVPGPPFPPGAMGTWSYPSAQIAVFPLWVKLFFTPPSGPLPLIACLYWPRLC